MKNNIFINLLKCLPPIGKVDVLLRPGLNIIRADKVKKEGEIKSNPRNSLGKSTFVRLIDYGLGSSDFVSSNEKVALQKLRDHHLLMEFSIGSGYYTLKRELTNSDDCYVYKGWVSEQLLNGEKLIGEKKELEEYKELLEKSIFNGHNFLGEEKMLSLRKTIPLLIRNQFNGFTDIYEPMGLNEGAQFSRLRSEFFSGLTNTRKLELESKYKDAEEKRKGAQQNFNIISRYIGTKNTLSEKEVKVNLLETESEIDDLTRKIKEVKEKVLYNENHNKALQEQKFKKLDQIRIIDTKLKSNITRMNDYIATINEISKEEETISLYDDAVYFMSKFKEETCPVCLVPIDDKENDFHCPKMKYSNNKNDDQAVNTIIKLLSNEKADLRNATEKLEEKNVYLRQQKEEQKQELNDIIQKIDNEMENLLAELNELEEKLMVANTQKVNLTNLQASLEDIKKFKEEVKKYQKDKQNYNKSLLEQNLMFEESRKSFIKTYDNIIKYLYDNQRRGIVEFSKKAGNLNLAIGYNNNNESIDNGAAAQTVKVIAYDLTLLTLSIKNDNAYPSFLVHDSPNINDIDPDVYNRIFYYIKELEEKERNEKGKVDFQYIITTITLPKELEKSVKYTRLRLENIGDGGKLFGFTF